MGFCSRIIYISVGTSKDGTRTRDMSPTSMKSSLLERRKMVLEQGICRQLVRNLASWRSEDGTRTRDMSPASMKSSLLERRKMVLEQGI